MSRRYCFIRRRPMGSLLLLFLGLVSVLVWQNGTALWAFPSIISAYTAKEYCSCRYVMLNSADDCRGYVKQYVPSTLTDDATSKTITASGLGRSSAAAWQSQRLGCRLQP